MPMEIDRDISDNECNIEVINNTLNTQITLVENIEEDVVQKVTFILYIKLVRMDLSTDLIKSGYY